MAASIKNVAEQAGVSTATVSHVINGTRYVSKETQNKVNEAMKLLDYRPNYVARSLRSQKSNTIGLLIPVTASDTSNFFFMSVAQGIQGKLKEYGYNLILGNSNENLSDEKEQIKVFSSQLIDGLIIAPTAEEHGYLNDVLTGDYPVVFLDRKPKGFEGDCVLTDGFTGTYDAINMLIDKGHRKIGYITGPLGLTTSDERLEGYKKALLRNNISIDLSYIKEGEATFEAGYKLAEELVNNEKITALFISNNVMTMGAMGFLQKTNIEIPKDIAVIGFDDYDWTRITNPPLTVIKQPSYQLGEKVAQIMLDRINNRDKENIEYRLATELILRDSC